MGSRRVITRAKAGADDVLVSSTVKDLVVGSGIDFAPGECTTSKASRGRWHLFAVDRS